MPRQRFFNLPPEARARLLGIATHHFAKHGFERASLNEILAEAGISKGAYYYYFDDKDDLFATTLESAVETAFERFPIPDLSALAPERFWPVVESFVHDRASALDPTSELMQVAVQLSDAQRKSPRFAPMLAKAQDMYRMLIEPGQRLGCIRTDLSVAVLVRLLEANDAVLDSIFLTSGAELTPARVHAHVQLVLDTFRRLLAVSAPALPGSARGAAND